MVIYAWLAAIGIAAFGGYSLWLADVSGDRRELKVRAEYNAAIERTNDDVREFTDLDEKLAAIKEAVRKRATEDALKVAGKKCEATDEQAKAYNGIPQ